MTGQLAMFGGPLVRRDDPATAKQAATGVDLTKRCAETLPFLRLIGPATARQIAERMTLTGCCWSDTNVVARRLTDLEAKGLAVRVGEQIGTKGRPVTIWEASS